MSDTGGILHKQSGICFNIHGRVFTPVASGSSCPQCESINCGGENFGAVTAPPFLGVVFNNSGVPVGPITSAGTPGLSFEVISCDLTGWSVCLPAAGCAQAPGYASYGAGCDFESPVGCAPTLSDDGYGAEGEQMDFSYTGPTLTLRVDDTTGSFVSGTYTGNYYQIAAFVSPPNAENNVEVTAAASVSIDRVGGGAFPVVVGVFDGGGVLSLTAPFTLTNYDVGNPGFSDAVYADYEAINACYGQGGATATAIPCCAVLSLPPGLADSYAITQNLDAVCFACNEGGTGAWDGIVSQVSPGLWDNSAHGNIMPGTSAKVYVALTLDTVNQRWQITVTCYNTAGAPATVYSGYLYNFTPVGTYSNGENCFGGSLFGGTWSVA
jgi:hypothetical protein